MSKCACVVRGKGCVSVTFRQIVFPFFHSRWVGCKVRYLALCLSSSSCSQLAALVFSDPADLHQAGSELSLFMGVEPAEAPGSFPFLKLIVSISYVTMPITLHFEICHSSLPHSLYLVLVLPKETFSFLPYVAFSALLAALFSFLSSLRHMRQC